MACSRPTRTLITSGPKNGVTSAAEGTGLASKGSSWARPLAVIEPDETKSALYDELYALYRDLHPATTRIQHALTRIQLRSASCATR